MGPDALLLWPYHTYTVHDLNGLDFYTLHTVHGKDWVAVRHERTNYMRAIAHVLYTM